MIIKISEEAKAVLKELERFVESRNTHGAGKRFCQKFIKKVKEHLVHTEHPFCKHPKLNAQKLRCFFINDWVIAYKKSEIGVIIFVIVHGSILVY